MSFEDQGGSGQFTLIALVDVLNPHFSVTLSFIIIIELVVIITGIFSEFDSGKA